MWLRMLCDLIKITLTETYSQTISVDTYDERYNYGAEGRLMNHRFTYP